MVGLAREADHRYALRRMEWPLATERITEEELAARHELERRGLAYLAFREPQGAQRLVALDPETSPLTIGRRAQADVSLAWDPEVSRLHAELTHRAGEWTLADDGLSQNGTFVNGMRVDGRRRLRDGDAITVGTTTLTFVDPQADPAGATLVPAALGAAPAFSEQQQRLLRALCRPLMGDGEGVEAAADADVAAEVGEPLEVVTSELDHLGRAFGLAAMPKPEQRAEVALLALRSGLVRADDTGF
jgi:hypothetical protein